MADKEITDNPHEEELIEDDCFCVDCGRECKCECHPWNRDEVEGQ
jgi:hypothetical protein